MCLLYPLPSVWKCTHQVLFPLAMLHVSLGLAFVIPPDLKDHHSDRHVSVVISCVGCTLLPFAHSAIAASPKIGAYNRGLNLIVHCHVPLNSLH